MIKNATYVNDSIILMIEWLCIYVNYNINAVYRA